ncbi:MAG TPA: hypothetical protein VH115_04855 [Solirubrobacteraceae bacterium]|nr:hypothetical protein [Solirubrobacteraceae bacterium]
MNEANSRPIGRTILAGLILLVAVWVLLKIVIGIVAALFVPIVAIFAIVAVVWAYRVLF